MSTIVFQRQENQNNQQEDENIQNQKIQEQQQEQQEEDQVQDQTNKKEGLYKQFNSPSPFITRNKNNRIDDYSPAKTSRNRFVQSQIEADSHLDHLRTRVNNTKLSILGLDDFVNQFQQRFSEESRIKDKQFNDLMAFNEQLEEDLQRNKDENNQWRIRHQILEKDKNDLENFKNKEIELLRYQREKENNQNADEKEYLNNQLNNLIQQLDETNRQLKKTQLAEAQENLEKRRLQEKLEIQLRLFEDAQQKHIKELQIQEDIQRSKIQSMEASHQHETSILNREIQNINLAFDSKRQQLESQKDVNININSKLIATEQKAKDQQIEAHYWKGRANTIERAASQEKDKSYKMIDQLNQNHQINLQAKDYENLNLKKLVTDKERVLYSTKIESAAIQTELQRAKKEKLDKEYESSYFKRKAEDIERQKNLEIQTRENLHHREQIQLTRTLSAEKEFLAQQLTKTEIQKRNKEQESEFYRHRAEEIERKKNLEIAMKDSMHFEQCENVKRSLSAEKEYLAIKLERSNKEKIDEQYEKNFFKRRAEEIERRKNLQLELQERDKIREQRSLSAEKEVLHRELMKKSFEASDWKNNYQRIANVLRKPYI